MISQPYEQLAEFYDLENAELHEDVPFWQTLAEHYGGPVLELGCGTGRVTLQLARHGFAVTGVDNSKAMLARAAEKIAALPRSAGAVALVEADLAAFSVPTGSFGLAVLPYNTFMHLLTSTAQQGLLARIRAALRVGGGVAFDVANPAEIYAHTPHAPTLERVFADPERGLTVQQFAYQQLNRTAQINRVLWQYDVINADGQVRRVLVEMNFRVSFPGEIQLLLANAGFGSVRLLGDFDLGVPLEDSSPRMVVVATAV